jgi:5-methylcytosine-specific restriction endonuclease McrA
MSAVFLDNPRACPYCAGLGWLHISDYTKLQCPRCQGSGKHAKQKKRPGDSRTKAFFEKYHMQPCSYCELRMDMPTRDHAYLPKSRGGLLTTDNTIVCCRRCNNDKSSLTLYEWHARLVDKNDDRAIFVERILIEKARSSRGFLMIRGKINGESN